VAWPTYLCCHGYIKTLGESIGLVDSKWEFSIVWKTNGVFYTSKLLVVDGVNLDNLAITFALVVLTYVGCLEC
jgi:hypothetical protein